MNDNFLLSWLTNKNNRLFTWLTNGAIGVLFLIFFISLGLVFALYSDRFITWEWSVFPQRPVLP